MEKGFWNTSIKVHTSYLERQLDRMGVKRVDRQITGKYAEMSLDNQREVIGVWLIDSLLWTCEEMLADRPVYALRGLLQAAGYAGEVGHNSITSDAYLTLRNALEDYLKP